MGEFEVHLRSCSYSIACVLSWDLRNICGTFRYLPDIAGNLKLRFTVYLALVVLYSICGNGILLCISDSWDVRFILELSSVFDVKVEFAYSNTP